MPNDLSGSCKCQAVTFTIASHEPYPFIRCYCSICRKTNGGGGYGITVNGIWSTLKLSGEEAIGDYRAPVLLKDGTTVPSPAPRRFCIHCHTSLYQRAPDWGDVVALSASCIDADLPAPPHTVHMMLGSKANWVVPQIGKGDECFDEFPDKTVEEWHRANGIWVP